MGIIPAIMNSGRRASVILPVLNEEKHIREAMESLVNQDMKDFVVLFQDNRLAAKENAVADLKRLFAVHWGLRSSKAAYKIHLTLFNNEIEDEYLNL